MKCQQTLERIGDLVDNDLDFQHRLRLRLHLLICGYCLRYLSSYRATIQAEKIAFPAVNGVVVDELPDELVTAILSEVHLGQ